MAHVNFGKKVFPTRSAGSGRVRANSARDGRGQGRGSPKRMAGCRMCGFVNDIRRTDVSGGDLTGNGSRGPITKTTQSYTLSNGQTFSETYGDAVNRKGAGCAGCGSKNSLGRA